MHLFQRTYYRMADETFSANTSSINLMMGEKKARLSPHFIAFCQMACQHLSHDKFDVSTANHFPFFNIADVQTPTNSTLIEDIDIFTLRFRIMDTFLSILAYVSQINAHII